MKPTDSLRAAADIYEERNKLYGDNYKQFGEWVAKLFPLGVGLLSEEDFNRFGVLTQILSKLGRYCQNFEQGGHDDSLDDLAVYAMMLKELDIAAREIKAEDFAKAEAEIAADENELMTSIVIEPAEIFNNRPFLK